MKCKRLYFAGIEWDYPIRDDIATIDEEPITEFPPGSASNVSLANTASAASAQSSESTRATKQNKVVVLVNLPLRLVMRCGAVSSVHTKQLCRSL